MLLHGNNYVLAIKNSRNIDESMLEHIGESVQRLIPDCKYAIYRDVVVALVTRKKKDFPQSCYEALMVFLRKHNLYAGVSNCFSSLESINRQYSLSLLAIELGIKAAPEKLLYPYGDYMFYHLLSISSDHINLHSVCPEALFSLMKYDESSKEDLVNCLSEYLRNDKNLQKTANVLGIHRNTLTYRIKKIAGILEADIEDKDTAFNLSLAIEIVRYIGLYS